VAVCAQKSSSICPKNESDLWTRGFLHMVPGQERGKCRAMGFIPWTSLNACTCDCRAGHFIFPDCMIYLRREQKTSILRPWTGHDGREENLLLPSNAPWARARKGRLPARWVLRLCRCHQPGVVFHARLTPGSISRKHGIIQFLYC
jgi:hypothetical protein